MERTAACTVAVSAPTSPVGLLVNGPVIAIEADATVAEAAALMSDLDVSALLVAGGGSIVTERDIARSVAAGLPSDEPVDVVATRNPVAVDAMMPIVRAAAVMLNEHVRHLVVELDGRAAGILSLRDIVGVLLQTADPELWLTSLRVAISASPDIWIG